MSWTDRLRVQRRTAVGFVVVAVMAGAGTGWAMTRGNDSTPRAEATSTSTPTPTTSASPSRAAAKARSGGTAARGTGGLTVTIRTPTGENPVEARFGVIDASTGAELGPEEGTLVDFTTQTGTLTGIPPGTYVVTAGSDSDEWGAAWYGPPSLDYDRSQATPITIAAGQTLRITVTLRSFPNGEPPGPDDEEPDDPATSPTPSAVPTPTPAAP